MKIRIIVLNERSAEEYFSSTEASEIKKALLGNNPNNALRSGYIIKLENKKLEILYISLPEVVEEPINEVNGNLKIYVKEI